MLVVIRKQNEVIFKGHAGFANFGKDIVCASASSIMYTTVNALKRLDKNAIDLEINKEGAIVKILKNNSLNKTLIDNMMDLLKDLEGDYPDNIKIKEE